MLVQPPPQQTGGQTTLETGLALSLYVRDVVVFCVGVWLILWLLGILEWHAVYSEEVERFELPQEFVIARVHANSFMRIPYSLRRLHHMYPYENV